MAQQHKTMEGLPLPEKALNDTITAIDNIMVGHAEMEGLPSGCTVVLVGSDGVPAAVDIRGGAPGTYGTDSLDPINLVDRVHGFFFSGGSAFGLSVAEGVRQYLKSKNIGFDTGYAKVPIVSGAIIFDLGVNRSDSYPDGDLGWKACLQVKSTPVEEGSKGAGKGATVGKLYGLAQAMKGGLGSHCITTPHGLMVGALVVVNAFGDIWDPFNSSLIVGCRTSPESLDLINSAEEIKRLKKLRGFPQGNNTVVGLVATNAQLDKRQLKKVAQMAHNGLARTVLPSHTQYDGDTLFAISCGNNNKVETSIVGHLASEAVAHSVIRAVKKAQGLPSVPSWMDLNNAHSDIISSP